MTTKPHPLADELARLDREATEGKPVVIVAGLGRCGSSLTMQMLHAAGLPCIGEFPSFEDEVHANHEPIKPAWLQRQGGRALKVLTPMLTRVPSGVLTRIIWLDRNAKEQARSTLKFASMMFGLPQTGRRGLRAMTASFERDRNPSLKSLPKAPIIEIAFEDLVRVPVTTASKIAAFLRPDFDLNPERMASIVRRRGPECQVGIDIELALTAESRAAALAVAAIRANLLVHGKPCRDEGEHSLRGPDHA